MKFITNLFLNFESRRPNIETFKLVKYLLEFFNITRLFLAGIKKLFNNFLVTERSEIIILLIEIYNDIFSFFKYIEALLIKVVISFIDSFVVGKKFKRLLKLLYNNGASFFTFYIRVADINYSI